MEINCPTCGSEVIDTGDMYRCSRMDQCIDDFKFYTKIAGYELSDSDIGAICDGLPTEEHEFTSKAGKQFKANLIWNTEEGKVTFQFKNTSQPLEGVLCPDHGVELRASDKRYYCPTKLEEGVWCPVGAWKSYGSHNLTPEELGQLLSGVPVGPWEMKKKDGTGTYQVVAEFDFDENKVATSYVQPSDQEKVAENRFMHGRGLSKG